MADISEEQYLAKDFDPASLRVADLRNLLTKHDIHYPSSAKKAMLVQIFQDDLKSKAKSILGKKSKVKPSGKGIIVVAPEQDDVSEDIKLEDEEEPSPPTTRGRKSKKKTATRKTAVKQEDSESEAEPPVANTPRKSRVGSNVTCHQNSLAEILVGNRSRGYQIFKVIQIKQIKEEQLVKIRP